MGDLSGGWNEKEQEPKQEGRKDRKNDGSIRGKV
jgi:hypothetical protein